MSKALQSSGYQNEQADISDAESDLDLEELDSHGRLLGAESGPASGSGLQDSSGGIPLQSFRRSNISSPGPGALPRDKANGYGPDGHLVDDERDWESLNDFAGSEDSAPLLSESTSRAPDIKHKRKPFRWKSTPTDARRSFTIGRRSGPSFPANVVSNAKYTAWNFLPKTLYNEFSFFFNLYFLLVALSQIVRPLRIGYLSTYVAPLAFVLVITLGKEALDDIARRRRDADANKEEYTIVHLVDRNRSDQTDVPKWRSKSSKHGKQKPSGNSRYTRLDAIKEEEEAVGMDHARFLQALQVEERRVQSRNLKVGDIVKLSKDQRVPADLVILKTEDVEIQSSVDSPFDGKASTESSGNLIDDEYIGEAQQDADVARANEVGEPKPDLCTDQASDKGSSGEAFIRTDQLDGETDWKLRLASPLTQNLDLREFSALKLYAEKPDRQVNDFSGRLEYRTVKQESARSTSTRASHVLSAPLSIDNTAWANTVLASNATVLAVVVYTGPQTRQALSTAPSRSKSGLLEHEINNLTKILCALTLTLSVALVVIRGAEGLSGRKWYVAVLRFLVLFSTIVPISLRVNLDMGKTVYARQIERDKGIPDTVVRTSTIPEELGRIEYLLSDKTGTLTQNEMDLKKIHVGTVSYAGEAMDEVRTYVRQVYGAKNLVANTNGSLLVTPSSMPQSTATGVANTRNRREISSRVRDLVLALAICHSVTPTFTEDNGNRTTTYQASSPDEIAIVRWAESVGLRLLHRDRHTITLQSVDSSQIVVKAHILQVFPFTSASKRMGIIVRFEGGNNLNREIWFYEKGADTVMAPIVAANDWLDEETANMAREGLRTLVVGRKRLSKEQYEEFAASYKTAALELQNRDASMAKIVSARLERDLELLGVTGVEDKLQREVKPSLELLRNAGIKIWMLTGDKVETARCVAISAKLVSRTQFIHPVTNMSSTNDPAAAQDALSILQSKPTTTALLIDGDSLSFFLTHYRQQFISTAVQLPAVIACRCSPTQKADIANLIRTFTKKRVACIGDGGNDVSMIQAADVGVGIVGKEGRQASLAADFSITSFHHLTKLLVWHGRNSYKRSAKLAQFVIHRGLIISVCQTFYSIATELQPHALYRDWLLVGYATVYTMAPVFSLVLDKDVDEGLANLYPELYKELRTGKSLSYRTFFVWVAVSIYQGGIIQGCSQLLVDLDSDRMISVSFTVLVLNELVMVAFEIVTWHWIMYVSILGTAMVYIGSIPFLGGYFDLEYMWSWAFAWRIAAISAISLIPPYSIKLLRRTLHPPNYRKVQGM